MTRRPRITTSLARGALALALMSSPAWAQSSSLDRVLRNLTREAPTSPEVGTLGTEAGLLLNDARDALRIGNAESAWKFLRAAQALNADHPDLFTLGASIAEFESDRLRAALLRRRALLADPADDANRVILARLIARGVPSDPSDVWVLATTLADDGADLTTEDRALMLRTLSNRLEQAGRGDEASVVSDEAGALAVVVGVPEILSEVIIERSDKAQRVTIKSTIARIELDPLELAQVVRELLRSEPDAHLLVERFEDIERTPASSALLASLLCETNRANSGDGVLRTQLVEFPGATALLAARARTLGLKGDYDLLRRIGSAQPTDNATSLELGALLLHSGAGDEEARVRIERSLDQTDRSDGPRFVRRALLGASIAIANGEYSDASELLLEAHRVAPTLSDPLRRLVTLHAPEGAAQNAELHTMAASRLLAMEDDAHAAGVLRATAALRRGYADIAEGVLLDLAAARPDDPLPARALVDLWLETERTQDAQRWLLTWLEKRPALSHLRVLLADVFVQRGRVRYAVETLEEWYDKNPGDMEVALHLENIYRNHTQAKQQAEHLQLKRLRRFPQSMDRLKESVLILARIGEPNDIDRELDLLLPQAGRDGVDLGDWSVEVFQRLYQIALRRRPGQPDVTPQIVRLHAEISTTPFEADRLVIRALGTSHSESNAVLDAVRRSMSRHPEQAAELAMIGAEELVLDAQSVANTLASERRDEDLRQTVLLDRIEAGLDLAHRSIGRAFETAVPGLDSTEGKASALLMARAHGLISRAYDRGVPLNDHIYAVTDAFLGLEDPRPVLYAIVRFRSINEPELREDITNAHLSEVLYRFSTFFQGDNREEVQRADTCLERALDLDPANPSANNDLGYRYAERGVRLDEAERMTMLAVNAVANHHSYLDSLGWVRYKLGVIEDEPGRRGAITLLTEADEIASRGDEYGSAPIILDHLGDALWAAGRPQDALDAWSRAVPSSERAVLEIRNTNNVSAHVIDRVARRYVDLIPVLESKIEAAQTGATPAISPIPARTP